MNTQKGILECVPNFSEGQDQEIIKQIASAIAAIPQQRLLHIDISPSANRTVMTFAGDPKSVTEAAFQAITQASKLIDMRKQLGAHPRIGATDVCPLVPLAGLPMQEAIDHSIQLAQRIGAAGIPVYLYEYSAQRSYRQSLPDIRSGQYEGLDEKMRQARWTPDYGFDSTQAKNFYAASGATVIGARDILVAFNISIDTKDVRIARNIARRLRSANGGLAAVRAIGWYMEQYQCAQVSFNLLDYRITSPWTVWQACQQLAASLGVALIGCEVIGLIPEVCLIEAGQNQGASNKENIAIGTEKLGLNRVRPFIAEEKILEQVLQREQIYPK